VTTQTSGGPGWAVAAMGLSQSVERALLANPVLATLSHKLRAAVGATLAERNVAAGEALWAGQPDTFVVAGVGARLRVRPEEAYPTLTVYRYQGAILAPWLWKPSLWPSSRTPRLDAVADVDSQVFVADLQRLRALANAHSDWGGRSFDEFLRLLFAEQILAIAPDMNSLSA
jgi:hypothetical protein